MFYKYVYIIKCRCHWCCLVAVGMARLSNSFVFSLISACVDKINNVFSIADDLEGYVHLLSKVTASKNSKVTFFDCHIQTDENTKVRAVCYSLEKRINIQQGYKNKSPVKISGVKASVTKRFNAGLDEHPRLSLSTMKHCQVTCVPSKQHCRKICMKWWI